jgi:hypothetical protein
MVDDLGTSDVSFPDTDSSASGFGSEFSVCSKGGTKSIGDLDEKELFTVAKSFLIAEINRLVEENQQLKQFKDKYHDVDKRLAVLKETIKPFRKNDFLSSVCLIAGSAGVGAQPSFLSLNSYGSYIFAGISAFLVVAGIIAVRADRPSLR